MSKNGTEVEVFTIPGCDICAADGQPVKPAIVDGKTNHGPWAYMCERHYRLFGIGLGTGRGQRLILRAVPEDES